MVDSDPSVQTWMENTSPFDRVWLVTKIVSEPRPARWITVEAAVSESAARGHLKLLVETIVEGLSDEPANYNQIKAINWGKEPLIDEGADLELGPNNCAAN